MPIQLYSASAGSGKTYRLAIEYISLAIHKEDPFGYFRKILAVTFTNKAAQEMRERILKFLHEIYAQKNSELITSVSNSLEKYSVDLNHELIIERAKNAHHQILQDYGLFSVMTIDSFVQKLSGSFWNELNLPNNYEIELDSDKIVDQVLNSILHKIQLEENQDLKTIFLNLVDETIDSESGWNGIRDSIKKFLKDVFSEDFLEVEEEFKSLKTEDFLYLNKKLKDFISKVEKAYLSTAQELCQIIQTNGYDHAEYWSYKNSGTIAHLFKLISGNKSINDNISRFPCDQEKLFNGLMDDSFIEKIYEGLCNLNNFRTNNLINYLFAIEIKKQMNNMAILRYFQNELSDFQNSKGIIPIAEFSKKIYQTIANDPVPFIYEKLGDRYEHLLIDEFQDTSMLQWKNFMPLLENASDGINQNLLVGDSKQAIYSFRGGDVKIFDALDNNREYNFNLGELDAIRFSNLKSRIDKKSMNDNYRSNPTIVEFNNQFYDFILKDTSSKSELLRNIYQNNIRQNAKKNDITLASDLEVFFSPNLKVSERNEIHKKSVLNKIIELSNEKIGYDKMAVLTRTNFQLSIIVEELLGNGIPIKSSDSLFIDFSPLYNFIKSILYFRINPDSKFHFFNIIHYSNLISDKKIDLNKLELTENRKEILIRTFSELGIDIKGIFQSKLGLIDTVHLIVQTFNLFSIKNQSDYLFRFLDILDDFTLRNSDLLDDFLNYLEENSNKFSINSAGDLNAVTVTTIHKSKGLEFPIVFLPFFMDNLEPNLNRNVPEKWINMDILEDDEIISINEDLRLSASKIKLNYLKNENVRPELKGIFEEEQKKITLDLMNAYYVATTRAGSKLYIYSQLPKENNFESFHLESLLYSFVSNNSQFIDVSKEDSSNIIYKMIPLPEEIVDEKETKVSNILDFDFHLKLQEKPNLRVIHDKKELYNKNERRRLLGNIIHDILANQTDKEFENELNLKEEELFEEIIFNIEKLKLDPKFSFIFNNENLILAEKDIILNEEKILRPDRVIKFEDIFYVIDFKTGNPSESHKKQVNNYKEVLEMMGYHPVRPVLVYLKSAHVEYV